tara:strand:- start:1421 stop:1867 length:447 start_codon:yes stop_codon:yes gene_type:complete
VSKREPKFEKESDRVREEETLRILLEGKDLTFNQLGRFAPVDAEIINNKTLKVVSLCEIKTMSLNMSDIKRVRTSVRKIQHCQKEALEKGLPLCIAWRFNDGIGYIWMKEITKATVEWGGMKNPRHGSIWDRELLFYIDIDLLTIIKF